MSELFGTILEHFYNPQIPLRGATDLGTPRIQNLMAPRREQAGNRRGPAKIPRSGDAVSGICPGRKGNYKAQGYYAGRYYYLYYGPSKEKAIEMRKRWDEAKAQGTLGGLADMEKWTWNRSL